MPPITVAVYFNPRSPHGERPPFCVIISVGARAFQSTLPARGATDAKEVYVWTSRNFNPRSPHGERPLVFVALCGTVSFQSTLPARGATGEQVRLIHAPFYFNPRSPHGERRCRRAWRRRIQANFNPRSPHGERRAQTPRRSLNAIFQSTLPARGATWRRSREPGEGFISIHAPRTGSDSHIVALRPHDRISIHAPRTGSDWTCCRWFAARMHFNPRSPHGERRRRAHHRVDGHGISIHAPRTGSDPALRRRPDSGSYFNPRSPHGERRQKHIRR